MIISFKNDCIVQKIMFLSSYEDIKHQKTIEKKGFEKKELFSLSEKETETTLFDEEITNQKMLEKNAIRRIRFSSVLTHGNTVCIHKCRT